MTSELPALLAQSLSLPAASLSGIAIRGARPIQVIADAPPSYDAASPPPPPPDAEPGAERPASVESPDVIPLPRSDLGKRFRLTPQESKRFWLTVMSLDLAAAIIVVWPQPAAPTPKAKNKKQNRKYILLARSDRWSPTSDMTAGPWRLRLQAASRSASRLFASRRPLPSIQKSRPLAAFVIPETLAWRLAGLPGDVGQPGSAGNFVAVGPFGRPATVTDSALANVGKRGR